MSEKSDAWSIKNVIIQRMEGIKLKRPKIIHETISTDLYSKFDDWPPDTRMLGEESLRSEKSALKVLDGRLGIPATYQLAAHPAGTMVFLTVLGGGFGMLLKSLF